MELKVLLPTHVLVHEPVTKVIAEAENGHFCLLPRHVDFVAGLVPGIFAWTGAGGAERYAAVDTGILVKCGREVLVSCLNAAAGDDLEELERTVARDYMVLDEEERRARAVLARLEAGTLRRFLELEKDRHA